MSNPQQYPEQPHPGDQTPRQQQQPTVGHQSSGVTPVVLNGKSDVPFIEAFVLSCVTFWCCGGLFGLLAFILAMIGKNAAAAGDDDRALRFRNASYGVSIVGIVIGIIIIGVVLGVVLGVDFPQLEMESHEPKADTRDSVRPPYVPSDDIHVVEPPFRPIRI